MHRSRACGRQPAPLHRHRLRLPSRQDRRQPCLLRSPAWSVVEVPALALEQPPVPPPEPARADPGHLQRLRHLAAVEVASPQRRPPHHHGRPGRRRPRRERPQLPAPALGSRRLQLLVRTYGPRPHPRSRRRHHTGRSRGRGDARHSLPARRWRTGRRCHPPVECCTHPRVRAHGRQRLRLQEPASPARRYPQRQPARRRPSAGSARIRRPPALQDQPRRRCACQAARRRDRSRCEALRCARQQPASTARALLSPHRSLRAHPGHRPRERIPDPGDRAQREQQLPARRRRACPVQQPLQLQPPLRSLAPRSRLSQRGAARDGATDGDRGGAVCRGQHPHRRVRPHPGAISLGPRRPERRMQFRLGARDESVGRRRDRCRLHAPRRLGSHRAMPGRQPRPPDRHGGGLQRAAHAAVEAARAKGPHGSQKP
ncbi:hypothetical protein D3C72_913730 [compost metagenome]